MQYLQLAASFYKFKKYRPKEVNRSLRSYFFTFLFVSEPEKCAAVNINDGLYL